MNDAILKPYLRDELKRKRLRLSSEEVFVKSQQICDRLIEVINWQTVKQVHIYVPIGRQREVSTWQILKFIWGAHPNINVFVPGDVSKDGLRSRAVTSDTLWTLNAGPPLPQAEKLSEPDDAYDLIIVPLIGFDKNFHRIGYGGGFYDRLMTSQPGALKVGLGYDFNLVDGQISSERHDVRMDMVVTETSCYLSETESKIKLLKLSS